MPTAQEPSFAPVPVRRVERHPGAALPDARTWPRTIPAVAQLLDEGLDLGPATVLVGANGSGKSTILEAVAMAFGLNPEGGSTGAMHQTRRTESDLGQWLRLVRGPGASRWGYFVRAETMHGLFSYLQDTVRHDFHRFSHGEAFVELLSSRRYQGDGFFVWDEPEAGLSFEAQLRLLSELVEIAAQPGAQVLLATHSPLLAALPGAVVLECSEQGMRETSWDRLDMVDHYRRFLEAPERYLRHLRA
ncbi:putative ABC transporter [Serinicoccus hydrothermalis]|uniref:Putative ABC transporter n=1 Tax=Serinicoccus hydrothermalis TaxID=1758689 RepID=A0A1B1NGV2_9MICO|nr:AAA family ATPase [Serinicoccus hydrothermalis]ANS80655.1 putative ABC transporter [Serinicoccus hydrothermalis]